jgi:hypothetical protein
VLLAWEGENHAGSDLYIDEVPKGQPARPALDFWHDAVSINGIEQVTVSFDAAGDATVMWRAGSGLYLVRRPTGGSFGAPVRIADEQEREEVSWPSFASGANGDATVVGDWGYGGNVAAWVVPHGSGPGAVQVLQREHEYAGSVRVAMAPDGEAIAAWYTEEYHEEGGSGFDGWLTVATRSPGASSFSAPKRIDPVPNLEGLGLAVSPSGEATLVYNHVDELVAVSRTPAGEWRPPEGVGVWATADPAAAYDASGNLYVAWHYYNPWAEPAANDSGYYAATRAAGGTFDGQSHAISRTITNVGWAPVMAANDIGAFATWALYDEGRVEAAGPLHAPWQEQGTPLPGEPGTPLPREPSTPLPSEPNSPPLSEPLAQRSPADQPASSAKSPPQAGASGVAAAKRSQPSAVAQELTRMLGALSARLRHLQRRELRFRSPGAGLLTIQVRRSNRKPGDGALSSTLLLGSWVLRHTGGISLRVAPSRRLSALLANSSALLIATFQPKQGQPTTARLKWAG